MHRQRIYRSTNAIHPKFVARVSCMHTTHLDAVLLIYKASSRLERHFCMWHVASTNQNHVPFCGIVVSLWETKYCIKCRFLEIGLFDGV